MATENQESRRKELNDINREVREVNGLYNDLCERMDKLGRRIWRYKKRIDTTIDGDKK